MFSPSSVLCLDNGQLAFPSILLVIVSYLSLSTLYISPCGYTEKRDNLQLCLSAKLCYQLKRFLTILDVEARVNGKGIVRAYRVVDDVVSIFHHVKGAIQSLAPVEKVEFFHAGPPVRNAVGADLPAEDFSIKGRGPFDVYDWDGEPAQLAVAFLL